MPEGLEKPRATQQEMHAESRLEMLAESRLEKLGARQQGLTLETLEARQQETPVESRMEQVWGLA